METGQEWIGDVSWEPSQQAGLVFSCSVSSVRRGQQRAGSVLPSARCKCLDANAPGHQHAQNFLQPHVTPCVSPVLTHFTEAPA